MDPGTPHIEPEERLLLGTVSSPVLVSVTAVPGREPAPSVLAAVRSTLEALNGPGTVRISATSFLPGPGDPDREWDGPALSVLDAPHHTSQRSLRLYFLDGVYRNGGREPLGTSREAAAFVFPDRLDDREVVRGVPVDDPLVDRTPMVQYITLHEMGHSLGLVGVETPMLTPRHPPPDQDPCQCHSDRPGSVMSYAAHGLLDDLNDTLRGSTSWPTGLDEHDWKDLRAHQQTLRREFARAPNA